MSVKRSSTFSNPVEFRISEGLYENIDQLADEQHLTLRQFAIASIGILNEAHRKEFSVQRTKLMAGIGEPLELPSLRRPLTEIQWPRIVRVALEPRLYDPLADYAKEDSSKLQERGRQAFRLGAFILEHTSPCEDEPILFIHDGKPTEILFRTMQ